MAANVLSQKDALKKVEEFIDEFEIKDEDLCQELYVTSLEMAGKKYSPNEVTKKLGKKTEKYFKTKLDKLRRVTYITNPQSIKIDHLAHMIDSRYDKYLLKEALECMNPLEFTVVSEHYGFELGEPKSLRRIAEELAMNPSDVRRIKDKALRRAKMKVSRLIQKEEKKHG